MAEAEDMIDVRNLVNYPVWFFIDEDHLRVRFGGYETKKLTRKQLQKLYYQDGGPILLTDYLSVQDEALREEFGIPADQIEYDWTEKDIDEKLLENSQESVEFLEDALEFGPLGIREMITDRAVALNIANMNTRKLLQKDTGLDIDTMIRFKEQMASISGESTPETRRRRRAQ